MDHFVGNTESIALLEHLDPQCDRVMQINSACAELFGLTSDICNKSLWATAGSGAILADAEAMGKLSKSASIDVPSLRDALSFLSERENDEAAILLARRGAALFVCETINRVEGGKQSVAVQGPPFLIQMHRDITARISISSLLHHATPEGYERLLREHCNLQARLDALSHPDLLVSALDEVDKVRMQSFSSQRRYEKVLTDKCQARSIASCSTTSGVSIAAEEVEDTGRFSDLLELVPGMLEPASRLRVIRELDSDSEASSDFEDLEAEDLCVALSREGCDFAAFCGAVLLAALPDMQGPSRVLAATDSCLQAHDTIVGRGLFEELEPRLEPSERARLKEYERAVSLGGSAGALADRLAIFVSLGAQAEWRMKRAEIAGGAYLVAAMTSPGDRDRVVEKLDAFFAQHFCFSAPMERQTLLR